MADANGWERVSLATPYAASLRLDAAKSSLLTEDGLRLLTGTGRAAPLYDLPPALAFDGSEYLLANVSGETVLLSVSALGDLIYG